MKFIILLVITLIFLGCAGSPFQLSRMNREQLNTVTDAQLRRAMGNDISRNDLMFEEAVSRGLISDEQLAQNIGSRLYRMDLMLEEAKSRKLFTDEEIELIKAKKARIGMSEHALIASWGNPGLYGRVNKSVSRYGIRKQFVYRSCSNCSAVYVYTENGKITSWQN